MEFLCCLVVCFCGVYFFFEVSDLASFSIEYYRCPPFFGLLVVPYSAVFRGVSFFGLPAVSGVLGGGRYSQVCISVVKSVVVNVVCYSAGRRAEDYGVHHY